MKKLIIFITLCLFAVIVLNGCDSSTPAYFEIVKKTDGVTSSDMYYFDVTVKNTGGGAGKNVICKITVKDTSTDKVVGGTSTIFSDGHPIKEGETVTAKAIFVEAGFIMMLLEGKSLYYSYELTWEDV